MRQPDFDGFQDVEDVRLHYLLFGKGHEKTLLFLHGNGEDVHCFDRQMDDFSKEFQVILLDSPGHGKSSHGKGPLSLKKMAHIILRFIRQSEFSHVSIVGFSDGANLGLLMALYGHDPFESMVLAGGNLFPRGMKFSVGFSVIFGYYKLAFRPFLSKEQKRQKELLSLMVREPNISPEALKTIQCPVLVMAGSRDMIRPGHTRMIARNLPSAQLVTIQGADHFIFGEWAEKTNEEILAFLRRI